VAGIEMNLASGRGEIVVIQEPNKVHIDESASMESTHSYRCMINTGPWTYQFRADLWPTSPGCLPFQFRYSCFSASGC
jgi:hypothetical protein